jgi:glycosyltransferase involved in cell wall biosynthesis
MMLAPRIAAVQHGDFREAVRLLDAGQPEPYFGMRRSVDALRALVRGLPYCVVSLDAPVYRERMGEGQWLGVPAPGVPRLLPETIATLRWRRQIVKVLQEFQPTHLLLRNGNPWIASTVLNYCQRMSVSVLVLLANIVGPWKGFHQRMEFRNYIRLLNGSNVFLVGNHKWVAAQSLIDHGVNPAKVVAWDFPSPRHPRDFPVKGATGVAATRRFRIVYAGAMIRSKGLGDLLDALVLLRERGIPNVDVAAFGDGKDLDLFRSAAPPGQVHFAGRASNDAVFEAMRDADVVCVPSRHEFTEGMPMTLTEALASRTPVVVSDHPVLKRVLRNEEGVLFAESRNPVSFAAAFERVFSEPQLYRQLSESTLRAYERVECKTTSEELLCRWAEETGIRLP